MRVLNIFSSTKTQCSVVTGAPTESTTVNGEKKCMREATADLDGGLCELRHYNRRGIADYGLFVELVKL